ncbi:MAG: hypothetical protein R3275_05125 [Saprospiraceae bacterium]|nr:hypothetical protein [Saprospiraceae bacterium]
MESLDKRKKELLQKYWEGTTTLEEERELRSLSSGKEDGALGAYFGGIENISERSVDIDVEGLINKESGQSRRPMIIRMNRVLAYAAAVLLLVSAFFVFDRYQNEEPQIASEETFEDPELALEQTREALAFVAAKMNRGRTETVENVKKIEVLNDIIPK